MFCDNFEHSRTIHFFSKQIGMMKYMVLAWMLITTALLPAQEALTAHDLFRMERVVDATISPDGSKVAYVVQRSRPFEEGKGSNYRDLFVVDVATGEHKTYLTGDRYFYGLQWHPDGKSLTFQARLDADKGANLYAINLDGGAYYPLLDKPLRGLVQYAWRPDGKAIAYIAIESASSPNAGLRRMGFDAEVFEEEQSSRHLMVYDMATGESKQVNKSGAVFDFSWSPNGQYLAAFIAPQNLVDDSYMFKDIYLIDPAAGTQTLWVDAPGKLTGMAWSTDNRHLAIVSAADIHDPVSGSLTIANVGEVKPFEELPMLTKGFEGHVNHVEWRDAQTLLYSSYESTYSTLRETAFDGAKARVLISGGQLHFSSFTLAGNTVAMVGDHAAHPQELFTAELKKGALTRHTNLNPWLADKAMGRQETISWNAKDGLRIDGVLIYPADYQEGQQYPMIILAHGGPEACVSDGWVTAYSQWGQIAAGKGYFVLYPNYRSSSGRGEAFAKAGFGDLVDEEFTDIIDGIDHLIAKGMVDGSKVGIGGGSYGGYYSAWAATRHSDRFAAACAFVGVSNQISKRNTTDIPYEDYYVHWGVWTNDNVELMYDRSPVKWVDNNQTPTLILHGKEDPRVHPSQSLELYRMLKMHGNAAVRLVWYPEEGHGNRNNPAQLDYALRTMQWFDFYLMEGHGKDEIPDKDLDYGLND